MFLFFFAIAMLMYIPLTGYVGLRLWQIINYFFPGVNKLAYWFIFLVFSYAFIFSFLNRGLGKELGETLRSFSYYWIIAMFYLFSAFFLLELLRIICKFLNIGLPFYTILPRLGIIAIIVVALIFFYGTWNGRNPRVTNYNITITKEAGLFKELRVAMISDIHLSSVVNNERLEEMVNKINSLNPDVVFIPGDIIEDVEIFTEENMMETFKGLQAPHGVFISLGNHEYYRGEVKKTVESLEQIGFHILKDECMLVADSFYVIGREDTAVSSIGRDRKALDEILEGIDKNSPLILLNHQPIELEEAQNAGIDLQVSGHTHRGQVFPANLITSKIFEKDWGHLQKGNFQLIVTSGYGTWGPPLRIGSKSEIVDILITFTKT